MEAALKGFNQSSGAAQEAVWVKKMNVIETADLGKVLVVDTFQIGATWRQVSVRAPVIAQACKRAALDRYCVLTSDTREFRKAAEMNHAEPNTRTLKEKMRNAASGNDVEESMENKMGNRRQRTTLYPTPNQHSTLLPIVNPNPAPPVILVAIVPPVAQHSTPLPQPLINPNPASPVITVAIVPTVAQHSTP
uniref:Uncharacterized protein n=1 Tax=Branchiostoma floridae TaxID=7739 RepID=C3XUT0_BRAFL|eukprot:XP_002612146.1 hypothetical protein BRAFLDRAFT_88885 [Branchiostoma floridae]